MVEAKKATAGKKVQAKTRKVQAAKTAGAAKRRAAANTPRKQVTSASAWKASTSEGFELEVPSGNVALVRPVGMQAFLDKGLIPNSLREIALATVRGKQAPEIKISDLDEEQLSNMVQLFDSVTVYCVLKPEVTPVPLWTTEDAARGVCTVDQVGSPIPSSQREDQNLLYVDDVLLEDKMFIFQFACGGTRSIEQFREEYASGMERVLGEQDVEADA